MDDDEDDNETYEYVGAYDKIDIVQYFIAAMREAESKEPQVMQVMKSNLDVEDQGHLQSYIAEAAAGTNTVAP